MGLTGDKTHLCRERDGFWARAVPRPGPPGTSFPVTRSRGCWRGGLILGLGGRQDVLTKNTTARPKDTRASLPEAPAGQIWDDSNIQTVKDSGEGEGPTKTGHGGGASPGRPRPPRCGRTRGISWPPRKPFVWGALYVREGAGDLHGSNAAPGLSTGHQAKQRTRPVGPTARVSAG